MKQQGRSDADFVLLHSSNQKLYESFLRVLVLSQHDIGNNF